MLRDSSQKVFITIYALVGGIAALVAYFGFFNMLGVVFTPWLLLATFILGAILGAFFADTGAKYLNSRPVIFLIAAITGLISPFFILQILFLVLGSGDF